MYKILVADDERDVVSLLDVNMPDGDGLSVCRKIRDHVSCPILFLTARVEDSDKISGFASGGDDYIIKPFSIEELGARVSAHIRRDHRIKVQAVVRLMYSIFFLAVIMGFFTYIMYCCESAVTIRHFVGGFATALFLGSLGFFFAGITQNTILGYMVSMIYYISNFALKDELKNLYLFSMSAGSFTEKYWLLGGSVVLFVATIVLLKCVGK